MSHKYISSLASVLIVSFLNPFMPKLALADSTKLSSNVEDKTTYSYLETPYTLGPSDHLHLDILEIKEYTGEYTVLVDGTISFPLIGTIKAKDLTIPQLISTLQTSYSRFIKHPTISVQLVNPRPLQIALTGEASSPGSYTLAVSSNQKFPLLTDVIKDSGGTTASADLSSVRIVRLYQGTKRIYNLNLLSFLKNGDKSQDISLRDGDSIFIPSQKNIDQKTVRELSSVNFGIQANRGVTVAVIGEIVRPGTYHLGSTNSAVSSANGSTNQPNSTTPVVSSDFPRVTSVLQKAGGTGSLADVRNIEIQRITHSGEVQTIPVDLWALLQSGDIDQDIILQDGDTITVPKAKVINPQESQVLASANFSPDKIRINVVGEVLRPGLVELPPNTPLNQAIFASGGFNSIRADQDSVKLVRLNQNGTVTSRIIHLDLSAGINDQNNPILQTNDVVIVNRNGLTQASDTVGLIFSPFSPLVNAASTFGAFNGIKW